MKYIATFADGIHTPVDYPIEADNDDAAFNLAENLSEKFNVTGWGSLTRNRIYVLTVKEDE